MGSLERKLARKQQQKTKKIEKKLARKLNMFDSLPESCLVCDEDYDRKNKEQAMSWKVVVRDDMVRLYCPTCWNRANDVVKKILGEKNESESGND